VILNCVLHRMSWLPSAAEPLVAEHEIHEGVGAPEDGADATPALATR